MNTAHRRHWSALPLAGLLLNFSAPVAADLISHPGGMVYDTGLGVTWLQDANAFFTAAETNPSLVADIIAANGGVIHDTPNNYDTPADGGAYTLSAGDFNTATGHMSWWGAQAWVGYLNSVNHQGYNDWRLPSADPVADVGYGNTSELGHLFYDELGGVSDQPIDATHNGNYSLLSNVESYVYWFATENAAYPGESWVFDTSIGYQDGYVKVSQFGAWVVRTGDVAAVPLPATVWLFGSALTGLCVVRRRGRLGA
ncbi:Lcl domain-containing protein [Methylomagnum sp.]